MIVGLEGIHTWDGAIVLNDRSTWPHYKVDSIPGLYGLGDFDPAADPATGRTGEVPAEDERGGKTIAYEGVVRAKGLADLRTAIADLGAAFAPTDEREMVAGPHPSYLGGDLPVRTFRARCLEPPTEERQAVGPHRTSFGYERPFNVTLRLSDPRYYHPDPVAEFSDALAVTGGTFPPLTPGGALEPPSSQGVTILTDNPGNADADALMTITGPLRNPILTNETTGHFLRFRDPLRLLDAGEKIEIDFRARTIKRPGVGVNVRHKRDSASTWWDRGVDCLAPGLNEITLRAWGVGAGASLRIDYYPADYS